LYLLCWVATHAACAAPSDEPPGLEEIIQRTVEAMGGEAPLESVESVFRQRNQRTFTLRKQPTFHLVVLLNDTGGVRYAEGYDGEVAWELTDDGPKTRAGERAQSALWHTTQWPGILKPLSRMVELGHTLELIGPDTVQGIGYHKLLLRLSDGFEREYYINAQTYRIERARDVRRFHAYEDEVQSIEGVWGDFREVDGVWVPFTTTERNFETGERLSGGTMRQVKLNVSVPDEVFTFNGSVEPFLRLVHEITLPASKR
jgi:hypothetical protein